MLVLSRKTRQAIQIGAEITVEVRAIRGGRVLLGVKAPQSVRIVRQELPRKANEDPREAA